MEKNTAEQSLLAACAFGGDLKQIQNLILSHDYDDEMLLRAEAALLSRAASALENNMATGAIAHLRKYRAQRLQEKEKRASWESVLQSTSGLRVTLEPHALTLVKEAHVIFRAAILGAILFLFYKIATVTVFYLSLNAPLPLLGQLVIYVPLLVFGLATIWTETVTVSRVGIQSKWGLRLCRFWPLKKRFTPVACIEHMLIESFRSVRVVSSGQSTYVVPGQKCYGVTVLTAPRQKQILRLGVFTKLEGASVLAQALTFYLEKPDLTLTAKVA